MATSFKIILIWLASDGGCHILEVETDDNTNKDEPVFYTDWIFWCLISSMDLIRMTFLH